MKRFLFTLGFVLAISSILTAISSTTARAAAAPHTGRQAPEFAGIEHWINSSPLTLAGLRGKVVLVNFWTFGCSNCQATLPVVARWYDTYRDRGLVVVGVHTPEFAHERGRAETEAAVSRFGLHYPVAQDNASATWRAYGNRYWPAFYFVDARGEVRYERFGEGGYEESEKVIQTLLAEAKGEDAHAGAAVPDAIPAVNAKDGVAIHGYDPVAYFTNGTPKAGDARYASVWQGATYRFASAENKALFDADPGRYAPQYGGYCAYAISIGKIADIDPARWDVVDGKLYLNNNLLSRGLWSVNRTDHIRSGDVNWAGVPKR